MAKPLDTQQLIYGGAEWSFYDLLFLRAGYKFNFSGIRREAIDTSIMNPVSCWQSCIRPQEMNREHSTGWH